MMLRSKTLTVLAAWTFIFCMMAVTAWAGENTWTRKGSELAGKDVLEIAIDPVDAAIMYAGTNENGCWKTENGGDGWVEKNTGLGDNMQLTAIVITPGDNSKIYAGTQGGGVYKSTDSAGNWAPFNSNLGNLNVITLSLSESAQTLFAGTLGGGGVFKTQTEAAGWETVLTAIVVEAVLVSPHNPQLVFTGTNSGLFLSTDGGTNFPATPIESRVTAITSDPVHEGTFYVGTQSEGLYKTIDNAETWTSAGNGLPDEEISSLTIIESAPHVLYAGTKGGEIYRTGNGGNSWTSVSTGLPAGAAAALASKPSDQEVVFAGTSDGVYEFTYIPPPGDINGDGKADLADAVLLLKIVADIQIDPETISMSGDPNDDDYLGIADAIFVLQNVAGL
jgi:photosystem II stability/assembly factor-like uncharacterized protein